LEIRCDSSGIFIDLGIAIRKRLAIFFYLFMSMFATSKKENEDITVLKKGTISI
jgi:hypothetical protein